MNDYVPGHHPMPPRVSIPSGIAVLLVLLVMGCASAKLEAGKYEAVVLTPAAAVGP